MSPNDRAFIYAAQALGHAGFAILDWTVALRLRPDLFDSGIEASAVNGPAWRLRLRPAGVLRLRVDIGEQKDVEVWAFSETRLAERIAEVTGFTVGEVRLAETKPAPAPQPAASGPDPAGDRYVGVATARPGRTCSQCERYMASHACGVPEASGIARPAARVPRRCLAFEPLWDDTDRRDGRALWPELLEVEAPA